MTKPRVRAQRDRDVLVITIDRPESLNAIDRTTSDELDAALDLLEDDAALRAAVLTGSGRAFCAGSDIKARDDNPAYGGNLADGNVTRIARHWTDKPLIASVNGIAFGGGAELVMACDIAVASPEATFGLPEVQHGLVAAAGGLVRGPRQLPLKVVLDMALTAEPITAQQALMWGLVSRLDENPLEVALRVAHRIADLSPAAIIATKAAIHRGLDAFLWGNDSAWERIEPDLQAVLANASDTEANRPDPS